MNVSNMIMILGKTLKYYKKYISSFSIYPNVKFHLYKTSACCTEDYFSSKYVQVPKILFSALMIDDFNS